MGQTPRYLVSMESSSKMQKNDVGFMLEYTVCTCSNLTECSSQILPCISRVKLGNTLLVLDINNEIDVNEAECVI